jgi:crossover junction endodeoxyribonuclease RuvC
MDSPKRILGIDPGLQVTGYGIIDAYSRGPQVCEAGVIRASGRDLADRITAIYGGIIEILEQFRPEAVAVEQLYAHYKHPRTAILMAHARGVIFLAARQKTVPLTSYSATRIKKTITGNGRASKDQIQRTIQRELGLAHLPEPADIADALAAALCHFYFLRMAV